MSIGFVQDSSAPTPEETPEVSEEVRHGSTVSDTTEVSEPAGTMFTAAQVFALIEEAVFATLASAKAK